MILLIGSQAARAWFPDFPREPRDWDAIAPLADIAAWAKVNAPIISRLVPTSAHKYGCRLVDGTRIEFEVAQPYPSPSLIYPAHREFRRVAFPGADAFAVTPDFLWAIKRAHAVFPIRWEKTMHDLHWLAERIGPVGSRVSAFCNLRRGEHEARYEQRKVKLAMSNEAFFAKSEKYVQRRIPHDRLHEIVAYGPRPLFERFKTDLSKASLDRKLFKEAPLSDRINLVREEAMVIALERYIIPNPAMNYHNAYSTALKRICTTLTSGWFRDFAVDHWPDLRVPNRDFVALARAAEPTLFRTSAV